MIYFYSQCVGDKGLDSLKAVKYDNDEYVEYINGYKGYVNRVLKNAEKAKRFSVFLDDDYTYDNIMKTCDDYARMADVQPVVTNTLGFDRYIAFIPVISMFVFFIVLFCIFNIQKEDDNESIEDTRVKTVILSM